jgi:hypothetical protein
MQQRGQRDHQRRQHQCTACQPLAARCTGGQRVLQLDARDAIITIAAVEALIVWGRVGGWRVCLIHRALLSDGAERALAHLPVPIIAGGAA